MSVENVNFKYENYFLGIITLAAKHTILLDSVILYSPTVLASSSTLPNKISF
jgi:hypothetical protein